ncbi:MAG: type III-B CRISPR module-associated protein Cmr5 [bacterium]|nr:type III-B CRISPR module-associated protein Cmr5 [bacterium]
MSRRRSIEQERAGVAFSCVREVRGQAFQADYARLAASAPADIQANGLGQTLAFLRAKGSPAHKAIYLHIARWVAGALNLPAELLEHLVSKASSMDEYRRATAEAMAFLVWLKRFAEAELDGGRE